MVTKFSAFLVRNPFARTPQDTGPPPPTPDPERTRAIHLLPEKATVRNQATLKELVCIGVLANYPAKCCLGTSPGWL